MSILEFVIPLQGTQRLSTRSGKRGYSFLSLAWLNAHWAPHSPRNPSHVQKLTYQDMCMLTKTHTQGHTHTQAHRYTCTNTSLSPPNSSWPRCHFLQCRHDLMIFQQNWGCPRLIGSFLQNKSCLPTAALNYLQVYQVNTQNIHVAL